MKAKTIYAVFDVKNCIINADPDTNKQRFDKYKRVYNISDVKMKRIIRDYFNSSTPFEIFNKFDDVDYVAIANEKKTKKNNGDETGDSKKGKGGKMTGVSYRFRDICKKSNFDINNANILEILKFLRERFIDWRLFGGILTDTDKKGNETGALRFDTVIESINKVNPREGMQDVDITCQMPSSLDNTTGSMGSTPIIKYGLFCAHGKVDPNVAITNTCKESDIKLAMYALWFGLKTYPSRNKLGLTPRFIIVMNYKTEKNVSEFSKKETHTHHPFDSDYRPFTVSSILPNDESLENVRDFGELVFDFSKFNDLQVNENIDSVDIYVDSMSTINIGSMFNNLPSKFNLHYVSINEMIKLF